MKPIQVSRKPTKCQNCKNKTVVEILYGDPTEEAYQLSEEGKLILGGCVILDDSPDWQCLQCKTKYVKI